MKYKIPRKEMKRIRWELGFTQIDLANALGVNESSVVAWEKGRKNMTEKYFKKLLKIMENNDLETELKVERI